jgi:hypothetical protein
MASAPRTTKGKKMILPEHEIDAIDKRKNSSFISEMKNYLNWDAIHWSRLIESHRTQSKLIEDQKKRIEELELIYCTLECP